MFGIGAPEFILIVIIGLVVFGPGKLPELARTIGKGMREFKKATNALTQALNAPDAPVNPPANNNAAAQAAPAANQPAPAQQPAANLNNAEPKTNSEVKAAPVAAAPKAEPVKTEPVKTDSAEIKKS